MVETVALFADNDTDGRTRRSLLRRLMALTTIRWMHNSWLYPGLFWILTHNMVILAQGKSAPGGRCPRELR